MTTSNHRPFTFPSGRIPLASGSGREAAVQYADWAIGDFLANASKLPWFEDTVFVFIADHTSLGRGRIDLEPKNFHIPFLVFSPKHIRPKQIDILSSQIDLAPTVLGLLGIGYESYFLGQDILTEGVKHQRAFMANYLTVGYLEEGRLVSLMPNRRRTVVDLATMREIPLAAPDAQELLREAIAHYQFSSRWVERRPR
jgi:phosphoglycerol transferase MdoB-like AlkP superfamily enzyme